MKVKNSASGPTHAPGAPTEIPGASRWDALGTGTDRPRRAPRVFCAAPWALWSALRGGVGLPALHWVFGFCTGTSTMLGRPRVVSDLALRALGESPRGPAPARLGAVPSRPDPRHPRRRKPLPLCLDHRAVGYAWVTRLQRCGDIHPNPGPGVDPARPFRCPFPQCERIPGWAAKSGLLAHVQHIHVSASFFPREEWVRDMGLSLCRRCKTLLRGGDGCSGPGCSLAPDSREGDVPVGDVGAVPVGGDGFALHEPRESPTLREIFTMEGACLKRIP